MFNAVFRDMLSDPFMMPMAPIQPQIVPPTHHIARMVQMMDTMMVQDTMASMRPVREVQMRFTSRPNVYPAQQPATNRQIKPVNSATASKPTKPPVSWTLPKPSTESYLHSTNIKNLFNQKKKNKNPPPFLLQYLN